METTVSETGTKEITLLQLSFSICREGMWARGPSTLPFCPSSLSPSVYLGMMRSDPREQEWGLGKLKQENEGSQRKEVFQSSALPWATVTQSCWDPLRNHVECISELSTSVMEESSISLPTPIPRWWRIPNHCKSRYTCSPCAKKGKVSWRKRDWHAHIHVQGIAVTCNLHVTG